MAENTLIFKPPFVPVSGFILMSSLFPRRSRTPTQAELACVLLWYVQCILPRQLLNG